MASFYSQDLLSSPLFKTFWRAAAGGPRTADPRTAHSFMRRNEALQAAKYIAKGADTLKDLIEGRLDAQALQALLRGKEVKRHAAEPSHAPQPFTLVVPATLLIGLVRVFHQQGLILLVDCGHALESLAKGVEHEVHHYVLTGPKPSPRAARRQQAVAVGAGHAPDLQLPEENLVFGDVDLLLVPHLRTAETPSMEAAGKTVAVVTGSGTGIPWLAHAPAELPPGRGSFYAPSLPEDDALFDEPVGDLLMAPLPSEELLAEAVLEPVGERLPSVSSQTLTGAPPDAAVHEAVTPSPTRPRGAPVEPGAPVRAHFTATDEVALASRFALLPPVERSREREELFRGFPSKAEGAEAAAPATSASLQGRMSLTGWEEAEIDAAYAALYVSSLAQSARLEGEVGPEEEAGAQPSEAPGVPAAPVRQAPGHAEAPKREAETPRQPWPIKRMRYTAAQADPVGDTGVLSTYEVRGWLMDTRPTLARDPHRQLRPQQLGRALHRPHAPAAPPHLLRLAGDAGLLPLPVPPQEMDQPWQRAGLRHRPPLTAGGSMHQLLKHAIQQPAALGREPVKVRMSERRRTVTAPQRPAEESAELPPPVESQGLHPPVEVAGVQLVEAVDEMELRVEEVQEELPPQTQDDEGLVEEMLRPRASEAGGLAYQEEARPLLARLAHVLPLGSPEMVHLGSSSEEQVSALPQRILQVAAVYKDAFQRTPAGDQAPVGAGRVLRLSRFLRGGTRLDAATWFNDSLVLMSCGAISLEQPDGPYTEVQIKRRAALAPAHAAA